MRLSTLPSLVLIVQRPASMSLSSHSIASSVRYMTPVLNFYSLTRFLVHFFCTVSSVALHLICFMSMAYCDGPPTPPESPPVAQPVPQVAQPLPSDPSSESSGRETDSFGIQVLLESYSGESSVHQPSADQVPVPEEATRSPHVVPYPYQPDEVIGGDSVCSIERRLLAPKTNPSDFDLQQAKIDAEDLFEIKVDIVRSMSGLHPEGDWMGRGARALDNPRTSTGEPSLEKLSTLLSDLQSGGVNSDSFKELKDKVHLRRDGDDDEHSAA
jgi:hypothetical protein